MRARIGAAPRKCLESGSEGAGPALCRFVTRRLVGHTAMRCLLPTRSRSIVIVLVDLDVVVDLDGDGDVDRDAPSWTVRSSSSACAAVSFRPAPRASGKVVHDGLRGANELIGAITMALKQLVDEVVDEGEELDCALIKVKALEAQDAILSATAA